MISLSLIACFILGILLAGLLLVAFIFITNSGGRDAVSSAREGWLERHHPKDLDE